MRNGFLPETFADLLQVAQKADIVSWFRGSETLSLTLDNVPGDRRTCIEVRLDRPAAEVRTLCGYNKAKNTWGDYCAPQGEISFPDRKGLKALRGWISGQAKAKTGFPNPEFLTLHRALGEIVAAGDGELFPAA